jgi:uncharacterized membrane protein YgcG
MGFRLLRFIILSTWLAAICGFTGVAHSEDGDYYYECYLSDGTYFESATPCDNYYDYDYPGFGLEFDLRQHHRDLDGDRDYNSRSRGSPSGSGLRNGGGHQSGGAAHDDGSRGEGPFHGAREH